MDSDNQLPSFTAPFFTITFSPIIILSHTPRNTTTEHQQIFPALLAIFAALFSGANIQPNTNLQGQPPASEAAMKAQRVLDPEQVPNGATCSVCIEELFRTSTEDEETSVNTVRCMPCDHAYHETCLFTWLKQSATCPTCRYEIESDNMEWNAASRRRTAERAQRTSEMREEQERQRRASRIVVNNQTACGLVSFGCCEFVDDVLSHPPDSAYADLERNIVMLPCAHSFHRNCLVTNIRVQGQNEELGASHVNVRCTNICVQGQNEELGASHVNVRCPCCQKVDSVPADELYPAKPKATVNDRPPVGTERQRPETNFARRVVSAEVLPETVIPEELETD